MTAKGTPPSEDPGGLLRAISYAVLAARFVLVVFLGGLLIGLVLYAVRFVGKVGEMAWKLFAIPENDILLALLHLVDGVLVASLVVIVVLATFDSLVMRLQAEADEQEMRWVARTDYSNLKIKLATAMVAISGIHLLQTFMTVDSLNDRTVFWRVAIHVVFVVSSILLGFLDWMGRRAKADASNEDG